MSKGMACTITLCSEREKGGSSSLIKRSNQKNQGDLVWRNWEHQYSTQWASSSTIGKALTLSGLVENPLSLSKQNLGLAC